MNITLVPVTPHRWLSQANLVARYSTVLASTIWACVVFGYETGFTQTFSVLARVMPEDIWALMLLGCASFVFWQTKQESEPSIPTLICNGFMTFIWAYTVLGFIIYWKQVPPGGFAACTVIMLLSAMNTLAIPKRE